MVEINLYQPKKFDVTVDFPSVWNELEQMEVYMVAKHLVTEFPHPSQQKAAIFISLINNRAKNKKLGKNIHQLFDAEDVVINGFPLVDYIYKENTLSLQPLPVIQLPGSKKKMYGPSSHFDTLLSGEFEDAEIPFLRFKDEKDLQENAKTHLANLAAILYRPENIPFITYNAATDKNITYEYAAMVPEFLKLHPWQLYTIFMWYNGCRNLLPKHFPTTFENPSEKDEQDLLAFTKCIHAAAGVKNGSREKVRRTILKELFFDMEQEALKAKELKAQYERDRK